MLYGVPKATHRMTLLTYSEVCKQYDINSVHQLFLPSLLAGRTHCLAETLQIVNWAAVP